MDYYFYKTHKTPFSFIVSGTLFLIMGVAVIVHNFGIGILLFILAIGFWSVKEGVEIDFKNNRFRKVIFIRSLKSGKWIFMDGIEYADVCIHRKKQQWSVNLHFSDKKYYRLFYTEKAKAKAEAAKIQKVLESRKTN
ncbi:MAG: hypothetical protein K9H84_08535 [Bacteroidales bacterium]|nr:hypothetical protein [Bacteroidales bacterium]